MDIKLICPFDKIQHFPQRFFCVIPIFEVFETELIARLKITLKESCLKVYGKHLFAQNWVKNMGNAWGDVVRASYSAGWLVVHFFGKNYSLLLVSSFPTQLPCLSNTLSFPSDHLLTIEASSDELRLEKTKTWFNIFFLFREQETSCLCFLKQKFVFKLSGP